MAAQGGWFPARVNTDVHLTSAKQELRNLDQQVWDTIEHGYKESSLANVQSAYTSYQRFCIHFSFKLFPATSWRLCRYTQYMHNSGKAPSTIANHISIIRTLHTLKGHPVNDLHQMALKLHLKGLTNISKHVLKQAEPMTPQFLIKMSKLVNKNDAKQVTAFTAILVGFFLLLRKSNLVPNAAKGPKWI